MQGSSSRVFANDLFEQDIPNRTPTREHGLTALRQFAPLAGRSYQDNRNKDCGPGQHRFVSQLSPYVSTRLISEAEVLSAALCKNSPNAAFKFIQEVFWRGYWKGWMEHRPNLWPALWSRLETVHAEVQDNKWQRQAYQLACAGETGIEPFDAWVHELVTTGYLHNHSRMWFASIWIFSLQLPWELGADFFYRHLIDGDPACNTLGWRWVAGLHTKGKAYLATAENIRRNAAPRMTTNSASLSGLERLASAAVPLEETLPNDALRQAPLDLPTASFGDLEDATTGLLLTETDLGLHTPTAFHSVAGLAPVQRSPIGASSELVERFIRGAVVDAVVRGQKKCNVQADEAIPLLQPERVVAWAQSQGLHRLVVAYAPSGPTRQALDQVRAAVTAAGIEYLEFSRNYDRLVWPYSKRGFFQLGKNIPEFLAAMGLT